MKATVNLDEYMSEIREQVCSRCIERPPGGPPCHTLGRQCGIELNLPELIDAVHEVHSDSMLPYEAIFHNVVCEQCPVRTTTECPCPLDSLLILAVQAIEAVDQRHRDE
jgi:hypothetical protein